MKQSVAIFKGLPASGKTTMAKEAVASSEGRWKRVNKDELRAMVDADKWSKEREKFIIELRNSFILSALRGGHSVIVDDTNLHPKHELHIRELIANNFLNGSVDIHINDVFCQVPLRECIRRDALRANPVGREVIRRMARQAGIGEADPYFIPGLPSCVICDLDGTLALMGSRNPFDASTCEQDLLHAPVAHYLRYLSTVFPIFYFSGREDKYRDPTERWLKHHMLDFHKDLVMRPSGNNEKDVLIKGRMFDEHIRGKWNVHVVLDDRNQVVDGWRDIGLVCFQVAEGNF